MTELECHALNSFKHNSSIKLNELDTTAPSAI